MVAVGRSWVVGSEVLVVDARSWAIGFVEWFAWRLGNGKVGEQIALSEAESIAKGLGLSEP